MMRPIAVVLVVACASTPQPAPAPAAQPSAPPPAQPAAPTAELPAFHTEELGTGLYAFLYPETHGAIVSGNSLVVVGDAAALVVDSGHFPSHAAQMIEQIQRWTQLPVRWLVNTHWHPDHNAGNGAFRRAFPGVAIISTTPTRDDILNVLPKKELTERQIAGVLAEHPRDEAERRYHDKVAAELTAFLPELRAAEHVAPDTTFAERRVVDLGHRTVTLAFLGRGNTAGDAVVWVPDARLLATGDLIVHPVPYPFGSFIGEWIATLRKLRGFDATTIVPGHGPVMHDMQFVDRTIALLSELKAQVDRVAATGASLDDTRAKVKVDALRAQFVGDDRDRAFFFDHGFLATAIRRAYREAKSGPLQDQD
ncbi:MAG TPA: MBL fold metallo-hydrolase [Kofleriaceae bacterium]|nr:MBL fold metallo-hydrolase [Kofleriaceae bacterium]